MYICFSRVDCEGRVEKAGVFGVGDDDVWMFGACKDLVDLELRVLGYGLTVITVANIISNHNVIVTAITQHVNIVITSHLTLINKFIFSNISSVQLPPKIS
jgi:hypothetical protein